MRIEIGNVIKLAADVIVNAANRVMRSARMGLLFALGAYLSGCTVFISSKVSSGFVPGDTELKNRYRVVESKVYRSAPLAYYHEEHLERLVTVDGQSVGMPALEQMYPGVFATTTSSIPISVEMNVVDVGDYTATPRCKVKVRVIGTENLVADDEFSLVVEDRMEPPTPEHEGVQVPHAAGWDAEINFMALAEGYSAAIVAALERLENGGTRSLRMGRPATYVKAIMPKPFARGQESLQQRSDGTMEAIAVMTGVMGCANAMQQAQQARNQAYCQRMAAMRAAQMTAQTPVAKSSDMSALAAAAAKDSKAAIPKFQKTVFHCDLHGVDYPAGQHCPKCMAPNFGLD